MTVGHLDTTKYSNLVSNASASTVISSSIFKAFIADVQDKVNSNYDIFTPSAWIAPTLLNSWVNYAASLETAGYVKDGFGFVHIKGVVKNGITTKGTIIFNLPVGYRPLLENYFPVISSQVFGYASVMPSGDVTIQAGSNPDFHINIIFKAEQ